MARTEQMVKILLENGCNFEDLRELGEFLNSEVFKKGADQQKGSIDEKILEILSEMQIVNAKTAYLKEAIKIAASSDNELRLGVIYARVGMTLRVSSSMVENSIRSSIEISWRCANKSAVAKYLGEEIANQERRPQNQQVIRGIVNYLLNECLK